MKTIAVPFALLLLLQAVAAPAPAQDTTMSSPVPAPVSADTTVLRLTVSVTLTDTIPPDIFRIVDNLGLNSFTARLISNYRSIPDQIVLEALARADSQTGLKFINAFAVAQALDLFCRGDSLWSAFFSDIERQLREPNILRFNFRDDQKWKSYALNELFYSTFFQELLLVMGNIGIIGSRDGKQWLPGWPEPLRWKYREYRFEYFPEDTRVDLIESLQRVGDTSGPDPSAAVRIQPLDPILPVSPADSVEPSLPRPHF